ncbi:MAG: hypothetical protein MZV65_33185 [Chromatiales bacterium]|nr:hypothetical protein [Chromatiales bacterium]
MSYHWNNFLWPLVITNSVDHAAAHRGARDLRRARVGRRLGGDQRRDAHGGRRRCWSRFLLFQRQFMQSFMQAGIK